ILPDTLGDREDPYWEITYNGTHTPGTINYTSIYSRDDEILIQSDLTSPLDGAHNIEFANLGHSDLYRDWPIYIHLRATVDNYNLLFSTKESINPTTNTSDSSSFNSITILLSSSGILVCTRKKRRL
ncbi:MAG: hypothetical protein ACW99Q_25380, partial [Candidatus Kariarchaeaceae archaeon]